MFLSGGDRLIEGNPGMMRVMWWLRVELGVGSDDEGGGGELGRRVR